MASLSGSSTAIILLVLASLSCHAHLVKAFSPVALLPHASLVRFSSPKALFAEGSAEEDGGGEKLEPIAPPPPPAAATVPPVAMPRRLDPLVARLTRLDSTSSQPSKTTNIPLLGEVAVDGGLVVLVPAAVIAILGFVMSINIAINSSDAIVAALANAGEDITQKAINQARQQYDENACRGLCSSQEQDLDSLRKFMTGLGK
jgi:hypothetical protein